MSDFSLSEAIPDVSVLENELQQVVRNIYETGNLEELTVKRVRAAAEKNLDLREGFFKESQWKDRSKFIIEVAANSAAEAEKPKSEPLPAKPLKSTIKALKRSAPGELQPEKRRKTDEYETTTKEVLTPKDKSSSVQAAKGKKGNRLGKNAIKSSGSELSDLTDSDSEEPRKVKSDSKSKPVGGPTAANKVKGSDSELSDVIDDEPAPKRKRARPDSKDKMKPASRKSKAKTDKSTNLDPDAEEIKRLQGWLLKCGIRKMWARELKPYDTPKEKIRHLKGMLSDAGMSARYSVEKAAQIREARELQADLKAVQEGAKYWGKSASEDESPRPKRRLAKGLEGLEFLNDDDGEDSG